MSPDEYVASEKSNLKSHMECIHEEAWHLCTKCEFLTTTEAYLSRHMRSKHWKVTNIVSNVIMQQPQEFLKQNKEK